MTDRYNLTFLDTSMGIGGIVEGVNSLTGGYLFVVMLFVVSLIIFMIGVYNGNDIRKIILANGFICTVVGVMVWAGGYAGFIIIVYPIILLFTGIILTVFGENN